jgi:hypothetical protein
MRIEPTNCCILNTSTQLSRHVGEDGFTGEAGLSLGRNFILSGMSAAGDWHRAEEDYVVPWRGCCQGSVSAPSLSGHYQAQRPISSPFRGTAFARLTINMALRYYERYSLSNATPPAQYGSLLLHSDTHTTTWRRLTRASALPAGLQFFPKPV